MSQNLMFQDLDLHFDSLKRKSMFFNAWTRLRGTCTSYSLLMDSRAADHLWCCLFLIPVALNHSITEVVFFHWLNSDALVISVKDFFADFSYLELSGVD